MQFRRLFLTSDSKRLGATPMDAPVNSFYTWQTSKLQNLNPILILPATRATKNTFLRREDHAIV